MKCLIIDDVYAGIQETLSQKMDVENLYEAEWEGKPAKTPLTAAQLAEKIGDCDILIMRVDPAINADVLAAAKNLKFIGVCSVGLNHVNMEIAKEKGIIVQNAPGLNGNAVAELTTGKMLDLVACGTTDGTWLVSPFLHTAMSATTTTGISTHSWATSCAALLWVFWASAVSASALHTLLMLST